MQKDPPDPIKSDFEKAAEISSEALLERRIAVLPLDLQKKYYFEKEARDRAIDELKDGLEASYAERVAAHTITVKERWENERAPVLKPKNLPSLSDEEIERLASEQAAVEVDIDDKNEISKADAENTEAKCQIVFNLEVYHGHRLQFRESFTINVDDDREDDHER